MVMSDKPKLRMNHRAGRLLEQLAGLYDDFKSEATWLHKTGIPDAEAMRIGAAHECTRSHAVTVAFLVVIEMRREARKHAERKEKKAASPSQIADKRATEAVDGRGASREEFERDRFGTAG